MKHYGADLIETPGTYEAAVNESKRLAGKNGWYNANPGGKNTTLGMLAYIDIPNEIMTLLRTNPTTMSIAVGNGTTLGGIHLGFRLLWRKKVAGNMPHMIAGSSKGNNPINESFKLGNKRIIELDHLSINETEINEPLINWHAYDGQEALNAIYDTGGAAYGFGDKALVRYGDLIREMEGIDVLPASTAALCALLKYIEEHEDDKEISGKNAFHVVVLTGRRNL
jgi:threonine synthase